MLVLWVKLVRKLFGNMFGIKKLKVNKVVLFNPNHKGMGFSNTTQINMNVFNMVNQNPDQIVKTLWNVYSISGIHLPQIEYKNHKERAETLNEVSLKHTENIELLEQALYSEYVSNVIQAVKNVHLPSKVLEKFIQRDNTTIEDWYLVLFVDNIPLLTRQTIYRKICESLNNPNYTTVYSEHVQAIMLHMLYHEQLPAEQVNKLGEWYWKLVGDEYEPHQIQTNEHYISILLQFIKQPNLNIKLKHQIWDQYAQSLKVRLSVFTEMEILFTSMKIVSEHKNAVYNIVRPVDFNVFPSSIMVDIMFDETNPVKAAHKWGETYPNDWKQKLVQYCAEHHHDENSLKKLPTEWLTELAKTYTNNGNK